jgi:hypothetical protein
MWGFLDYLNGCISRKTMLHVISYIHVETLEHDKHMYPVHSAGLLQIAPVVFEHLKCEHEFYTRGSMFTVEE